MFVRVFWEGSHIKSIDSVNKIILTKADKHHAVYWELNRQKGGVEERIIDSYFFVCDIYMLLPSNIMALLTWTRTFIIKPSFRLRFNFVTSFPICFIFVHINLKIMGFLASIIVWANSWNILFILLFLFLWKSLIQLIVLKSCPLCFCFWDGTQKPQRNKQNWWKL